MTTCVFRYCKNTSRNVSESSGVSFHRFIHPGHPKREEWIKILQKDRSEDTWLPTTYSFICSAHFQAGDIYTTKAGKRFLKKLAIPCSNPSECAVKSPQASPTSLDKVQISESETIFDTLRKIKLEEELRKVSAANKSERTNKSSERLPAEQEDEIKVFCPKCDTEVSHSAEGIQNDQTKIIIAKVYHYFEQEYEELKKMCEGLDLTPLSKFRQRTALATGVSESTVLEILQEEEKRKAKEPHVQLLVQREARKRSRQSESSSEEDSFESDDDDDEQPSTDHATDILVVKEEPLEISNEEPEIYGELAVVKAEPGVSAANEELADPLVVNVKIEPHSEEATDPNETRAVQPASKRYKGRTLGRSAEAPPGPSAPPSSSALPGPSAPPGPSASPGTFAPSGTCERVLLPLEVGEIKFEDIEIKEEGFS